VPAPLPDFADPGIAYDQRHIALNATVHNVNDVHMGYHERRLCRRRGSHNEADDNQWQ